MKQNKLFMCLAILLMSVFTFNISVKADTEYVAKIGDVKYETLDEAVKAAVSGDTIYLLKDATTENGFGLKGITLTIDGNGYNITFVDKTIYLAQGIENAILTFKNSTIDMTKTVGTPTISGEGYSWASIVLNWNCQLNLENTTLTMDGINSQSSATAVYMHFGASMTLTNSNMTAENYAGNGFSTDDGNYDVTVNLNNSNMTLNKNRTGFNSNYVVNVNNYSTLTVTNSRGHGSNGADYFVDNSTVFYDSNGSHGMSSRNVIIKNGSKVTSNNNRYYGVYVNGSGEFLVDSTSSLTTNGNGYAGLRLLSSEKSSVVKNGGTLVIDGNHSDGLYNQRTTVFEEGSHIEIMLNHDTGKGGGIYNTGTLTLPSNAVIYNNHADKAGDDIYSSGTIILGFIGENWYLDGEPDCDEQINGWYDDSENTRWLAHAEVYEDNHVVKYEAGKYEGVLALKAAHDIGRVNIKYVEYIYDEETGEVISEKEIADSITLEPKKSGDTFETSAKEIKDYRFDKYEFETTPSTKDYVINTVYDEENEINVETGKYIFGEVTIKYVYYKVGNVIINFVDTDGNELATEVKYTDKVGNEYQTYAYDIPGYTLIDHEGEETGVYIDGTIYVTYYYDKNTGTGDIEPPKTGVSVNTITSLDNMEIILYKKEEDFE